MSYEVHMDRPGIVRKFQGLARCIVITVALGLAACGGGDDDGGQSTVGTQPTQPAPAGIGAAGGTVAGPNGSKVEIPRGALTVVTAIAVDQCESFRDHHAGRVAQHPAGKWRLSG
jgi:hypothetical protein